MRRILVLGAALILLAAVLMDGGSWQKTYRNNPDISDDSNVTKPEQQSEDKDRLKYAIVIRVIDGDTIELAGGERVRYIGIDADEAGEFCYEEARNRNKELVGGKSVRLEYDEELKDKYGRILAYVWVENEMINLQLVKEGYAESYSFPPNTKYAGQFDAAEREAKDWSRGCWTTTEEFST